MKANQHGAKAVPYINVTPLIDVLLVLLIIFMVVSPLKPASFKALIPERPDMNQLDITPDDHNLVVTIKRDGRSGIKSDGRPGHSQRHGQIKREARGDFSVAQRASSFPLGQTGAE